VQVRNRWHRLQQTHSLTDESHQKRVHEAAVALLIGGTSDSLGLSLGDQNNGETPSTCIKGADHGRAMWSPQEDAMIEEGVRKHGCRWRQIAASLPGRSDSSVRNRWMRMLKDREAMKSQNDPQRQRRQSEPRPPPLPPPSRGPVAIPPAEALAARVADFNLIPHRTMPPNATAVNMIALRIAEGGAPMLPLPPPPMPAAHLPAGIGMRPAEPRHPSQPSRVSRPQSLPFALPPPPMLPPTLPPTAMPPADSFGSLLAGRSAASAGEGEPEVPAVAVHHSGPLAEGRGTSLAKPAPGSRPAAWAEATPLPTLSADSGSDNLSALPDAPS